jgi:hypothetical protein
VRERRRDLAGRSGRREKGGLGAEREEGAAWEGCVAAHGQEEFSPFLLFARTDHLFPAFDRVIHAADHAVLREGDCTDDEKSAV